MTTGLKKLRQDARKHAMHAVQAFPEAYGRHESRHEQERQQKERQQQAREEADDMDVGLSHKVSGLHKKEKTAHR